MRLFVSIDLPETLAAEIERVQAPLDRDGLNLTDPTQAHVTLKFLGEVDADRLPEVRAAVERGVAVADVDPFEARYGGYGVFPSLDYVSVVWLGVETGGAEMTALHEGVEAELTGVGFDPEDHSFTPHVTLARMEHAGSKDAVKRLVRERDPTVGTDRVTEVALTESDLGPGGPDYSTVASFPL